jgi:hypothetical protein
MSSLVRIVSPRNLVAALLLSCVSCIPSLLLGQYIWTGATDEHFAESSNWSALPPVNTNNIQLVFGSANRYVLDNNLTNLRFFGLTFAEDAGDSYVLDGNLINVQGDGTIRNLGVLTHTIATDLHFLGGLSAIDTGEGSLVLSGTTTRAGATLELRKQGGGTLELQGNHSAITTLTLQRGELVLKAGSTVSSSMNLTFNAANSGGLSGPAGAGGSAVFRVEGASSGTTTVALGTLNTSFGNQNASAGSLVVVVDPNGGGGTVLDIATFSMNNDSTHPVRFDFSAAGSSVEVTLPNVTNGISRNVTITSGGKTGFAAQSGDQIVRYTAFDPFPAVAVRATENPAESRTFANINYAISGNSQIASTHGTVQVSSLTIQGAGTITGINTSQVILLQGAAALLMEEGFAEDFTSEVRISWGAAMGYIHQYNTQATLYLLGGVGDTGSATGANNARFVKTGAGRVVIDGQSDMIANSIWVNEGRLDLHGSFASVAAAANQGIFVSDTAVLGGSATIGTNTHASVYTGANRQARIVVAHGGTLDASNNEGDDAIYIAGELVLREGANYHVSLGEERGNAFHIARTSNETVGNNTILTITNANLSLDLTYAPELSEKIVLLTWDNNYDRSGQFLTVNGGSFHGDDNNLFFLEFDGYDYEMQLIYDNTSGEIYVNVIAIPEPGTVTLLIALALSGLVCVWRRRKS